MKTLIIRIPVDKLMACDGEMVIDLAKPLCIGTPPTNGLPTAAPPTNGLPTAAAPTNVLYTAAAPTSNTSAAMGFCQYMEQVIAQIGNTHKPRTVETYRTALNSFLRFRDNQDLPLSALDKEMATAYERWLQQRGVKPNSTSFYMRILRAVYKRAVSDCLVSDCHPFEPVFTGMARTTKRAVDASTIHQLAMLPLSDAHARFARDMFLFSFYTQGMSFVDMAYLKKSDIVNGRLCYQRQKTGQTICVGWTQRMQDIVDRHPSSTGYYLLPIVHSRGQHERSQFRYCQYQVNQQLAALSLQLNLPTKLTMYVARHSWASIAHSLQVPIEVISLGMGHHSEQTTQIYIKEIDNGRLDQVNQQLISMVAP